MKSSYDVNGQIKAREVRLISSEGEQLGIVPLEKALEQAEEAGLDLVEVAPEAKPSVCRIMDYKKLLYEQKRKMREAKKKSKSSELKEVKMTPAIDTHDYNFKLSHARKFLQSGNKVKISIFFRGRQMAHQELGSELLSRVEEDLKDVAEVDNPQQMAGRTMSLLLTPKK